MNRVLASALFVLLTAGCASYTWRSSVPERMRTVQVPTFCNSSKIVEAGAVATRQVLRELQREGTFKLLSDGAAIEIQGEVLSVGATGGYSNYKVGSRIYGSTVVMKAKVSVIDKANGRVLIDNRLYTGEAEFSTGQDSQTAQRDASGRAADLMAQRIVDDLLTIDFKSKTEK